MTSGARVIEIISPDDYLTRERESPVRNEYVNGVAFEVLRLRRTANGTVVALIAAGRVYGDRAVEKFRPGDGAGRQ